MYLVKVWIFWINTVIKRVRQRFIWAENQIIEYYQNFNLVVLSQFFCWSGFEDRQKHLTVLSFFSFFQPRTDLFFGHTPLYKLILQFIKEHKQSVGTSNWKDVFWGGMKWTPSGSSRQDVVTKSADLSSEWLAPPPATQSLLPHERSSWMHSNSIEWQKG